jgi:hypothetical protein
VTPTPVSGPIRSQAGGLALATWAMPVPGALPGPGVPPHLAMAQTPAMTRGVAGRMSPALRRLDGLSLPDGRVLTGRVARGRVRTGEARGRVAQTPTRRPVARMRARGRVARTPGSGPGRTPGSGRDPGLTREVAPRRCPTPGLAGPPGTTAAPGMTGTGHLRNASPWVRKNAVVPGHIAADPAATWARLTRLRSGGVCGHTGPSPTLRIRTR